MKNNDFKYNIGDLVEVKEGSGKFGERKHKPGDQVRIKEFDTMFNGQYLLEGDDEFYYSEDMLILVEKKESPSKASRTVPEFEVGDHVIIQRDFGTVNKESAKNYGATFLNQFDKAYVENVIWSDQSGWLYTLQGDTAFNYREDMLMLASDQYINKERAIRLKRGEKFTIETSSDKEHHTNITVHTEDGRDITYYPESNIGFEVHGDIIRFNAFKEKPLPIIPVELTKEFYDEDEASAYGEIQEKYKVQLPPAAKEMVDRSEKKDLKYPVHLKYPVLPDLSTMEEDDQKLAIHDHIMGWIDYLEKADFVNFLEGEYDEKDLISFVDGVSVVQGEKLGELLGYEKVEVEVGGMVVNSFYREKNQDVPAEQEDMELGKKKKGKKDDIQENMEKVAELLSNSDQEHGLNEEKPGFKLKNDWIEFDLDGVRYSGGIDYGAPMGTPIPKESEGKVVSTDDESVDNAESGYASGGMVSKERFVAMENERIIAIGEDIAKQGRKIGKELKKLAEAIIENHSKGKYDQDEKLFTACNEDMDRPEVESDDSVEIQFHAKGKEYNSVYEYIASAAADAAAERLAKSIKKNDPRKALEDHMDMFDLDVDDKSYNDHLDNLIAAYEVRDSLDKAKLMRLAHLSTKIDLAHIYDLPETYRTLDRKYKKLLEQYKLQPKARGKDNSNELKREKAIEQEYNELRGHVNVNTEKGSDMLRELAKLYVDREIARENGLDGIVQEMHHKALKLLKDIVDHEAEFKKEACDVAPVYEEEERFNDEVEDNYQHYVNCYGVENSDEEDMMEELALVSAEMSKAFRANDIDAYSSYARVREEKALKLQRYMDYRNSKKKSKDMMCSYPGDSNENREDVNDTGDAVLHVVGHNIPKYYIVFEQYSGKVSLKDISGKLIAEKGDQKQVFGKFVKGFLAELGEKYDNYGVEVVILDEEPH